MADNKLNLVVQFSAVDKLGGALKNIIGLGRTGDQALRGLRREARDLTGQMRAVQSATAQATGNVSNLINQERELEAALARVNRQIERQKRINVIDARVDRVKARGAELRGAGRDNVVSGSATLLGMGLALKGAVEFDGKMADIGIKLGINGQQTAKLGQQILIAAKNTRQLPTTMQLAADQLASAGVAATDIPNILAPIGKVATAYNALPEDLAGASSAAIQNLGIKSTETSKALGLMAVAGKAGKFEIKDMAAQFPMLAASAATLKQKGLGAVADLSAAAQITAQGVGGDMSVAGNNLNNLLLKINGKETIANFKKMGVDLPAALRAAYAKGKTPIEAIAELTNKTLRGDLQKLSQLFGDVQAGAALQQLIPKIDEYRKLRSDIQGRTGEVETDFARKAATSQAGLVALLGNLQRAGILIGSTVLPDLVKFSEYLTGAANKVSAFAKAHPTLIRYIIMAAASAATFRVGLGVLQFAFGTIIGPIATMWGWWAKFQAAGSMAEAFPAAARALAVLRTAAVAAGSGLMTAARFALAAGTRFVVAGAQWTVMAGQFIVTQVAAAGSALLGVGRAALVMGANFLRAGIMMLANPMVLIVMAIALAVAGVAYLVWSNWDRIKLAFTNGIAAVKGALAAAPAWLRGIGSAMMQGLLMALNPGILAARLLSIARTGITAFKNFFGIKSPSRLFMAMGGHITSGLAIGIDRGGAGPQRAVSRLAGRVAAAGALAITPPAFAVPQPADLASQAMRPVPMIPAGGRPARHAPGQAGPQHIEIHIHQQAGEDSRDLARRVAEEVARLQRRQQRGSYGDDF